MSGFKVLQALAVRPSEHHQQLLQQARLRPDPQQQQALARLDALQARILAPRRWYSRKKPVQGLYLWGPVGTGKTLLSQLFLDCLPHTPKTRQHYQQFMAGVQRELHALHGTANPLREIGRRLAAAYRVICLDELYLTDLGDAMIVYNLFDSLFREGVALLITSNFPPEELFKDELQPAIFQPAIRLIRIHTEAVRLEGDDYRRRRPARHGSWLVGEDVEGAAALFDGLNRQLWQSEGYDSRALTLHGHEMRPLRRHATLAWFSFAELCEKPRSARDYLQLADRFSHLLLSGVPAFGARERTPGQAGGTDASLGRGRGEFSASENAQRRFMSLVDECYDRGIKLYVQASVPLQALHGGARLAFEFQRTLSRLEEMQTPEYLARRPRDPTKTASTLS